MKRYSVSDEDLLRILSYEQKKAYIISAFWAIIRGVFVFSIIVLLVYIIANFNALKTKFVYWYSNDLIISTENNSQDKPVPLVKTQDEPMKPDFPLIAPNMINIPSISVNAPIVWGVTNTDSEVAKNLENGVIQIHGTALPGQAGNVYITGHSSNYSWTRGSYNNIFALLDKLVVGDIVYLNYHDAIYSYTVSSTKVVLATDLSVLYKTEDSRLSLVTCWPVGTSFKRLVVVAQQTYPDPKTNTETTATLDASKLPSGR